MTRRGRYRHRVERLRGERAARAVSAQWILLVAASPSEVVVDGRAMVLARFDALLGEGAATLAPTVGSAGAADLLLVTLCRVPDPVAAKQVASAEP